VLYKRLVGGLIAASVLFGFAHSQERIVSLGGDITEIVYALGAGDKLVATDSTSVYPAAARETPKVGYVRRLSAEGVLSVEPDLILISGSAGPETALEQIEASGVKIVSIKTEYTPEVILKKIDVVSEALGRESKGRALRAGVEASIAEAAQRVDALDLSPNVLFYASMSDGAPRAAGKDTAAHGVIEMIGGKNVFKSRVGYKSLSLEAAVAADPDIILVMAHNVERAGGLDAIRQNTALSLTKAAQEGLVFVVDPVTVMQFGPRTPAAVADLAEQIAETLGE